MMIKGDDDKGDDDNKFEKIILNLFSCFHQFI